MATVIKPIPASHAGNQNNLYGIVDMGSNGIRFSISDLSPPTSRMMPTLFQDRAGISLYDAQYQEGNDTRLPISEDEQDQVVSRLQRFKEVAEDFGVPPANIYVLATEATRTAPNSEEFRAKIKNRTGWDVRMLSKEEEGRIGALGVASSLEEVQGLVMDLGGGSTQITWISAKDGVTTSCSKGSISLPYGAAALNKRLEEAQKKGNKQIAELEQEMTSNFQNAYEHLDIPQDLKDTAATNGGFHVYLSGGGFRGWGYLLMSQSKVNPYPIPTINGFKVNKADFQDTATVQKLISKSKAKIFRVSDRRASQVPAVSFLVNVLASALPTIKDIHFCQGGVREGFLFDTLSPEVRSQSPLIVATIPYKTSSADVIASLLSRAIPYPQSSEPGDKSMPTSFTLQLLAAVANLMYAHSSVTKDSRPASALHTTTTGLLVSAHGLSHTNRALLSLILFDRWPGDLSPSDQQFLQRLRQIVSMQEAWWCRYIGRVAALICNIYPAGVIRGSSRVDFESRWVSGRGKKGLSEALELVVKVPTNRDGSIDEVLKEDIRKIEKVGKKKNWIKASDRVERSITTVDWGYKIDVELEKSL